MFSPVYFLWTLQGTPESFSSPRILFCVLELSRTGPKRSVEVLGVGTLGPPVPGPHGQGREHCAPVTGGSPDLFTDRVVSTDSLPSKVIKWARSGPLAMGRPVSRPNLAGCFRSPSSLLRYACRASIFV